jgi:serine/threonine protein kinase
VPQDRAHLPFPPPQPSQAGISEPAGVPQPRPSNAFTGGTYFLGRYRVVDEIGIGGMASVHLARMDGPGGFQKWVAIKRIHPHLVEDESFVNMFLDEARVAARISHPNVATVFELGKHEDTYWIAMEYLHGEPLREVMRRTEEIGQPMPPEIACRVIADAAEGLHSAHELLGKNGEKLGLVHRDVTPHNLFVTYDGTTKVVDFGIAKFSSRMANTRAGTLKGKLAYMSPEQVAGEPIDRRTDVFALGVVLWELTTGQRLFRMESDLDTLAKVQECNVPRPSTLVRGYPIDLEKIVMKGLAKTKNERYRTAREFSRALQSLLMRRGLFIASDEVSAYMQSVFGDRIQKREAHLRWAAEVTQTIDIDKMKGLPSSSWKGDDGSILTYNSEVQPSQSSIPRAQPAPRPAAGMPAASAPPAPSLPTHALGPTARAGGQRAPQNLNTTMPMGTRGTPPPPATRPQVASLPEPVRSEDPPTLARPRGPSADGSQPMAGASFDDDFEDIGDTIVSDSLPDMDDSPAPSGPLPAAGLPPPGVPMQPPAAGVPAHESVRMSLTHAASPHAMAAASPVPMAPQTQGMAFSTGPRTVPPRGPQPAALPPVVVPPSNSPDAEDMDDTLAKAASSHLAYPQPLLNPTLQSEYAPQQHPQQMMQGTMPMMGGPMPSQRMFAPQPQPQRDQRTVTAQSLKKRVPVWAVAVGSAALGLLAFAVVLVLVSRPTPRPRAVPGAVSTASTGGTPPPSAAGGPFTSARTAFLAAIATPPGGDTPNNVAPPATTNPAPPPPDAPASSTPTPASTTSKTAKPTWTAVPVAPTDAPAPASPAAQGTLKVICVPSCDQVFDNGAPLGPSPVVKKTSVGSHRLKLVWGDANLVVSTVVIADQSVTVRQNHP